MNLFTPYIFPENEYILHGRLDIYCNSGWIYTATAVEYILQLPANIYFTGGGSIIAFFDAAGFRLIRRMRLFG